MTRPQTEPVRRHSDGAIDIGFYTRRAAALRAEARRQARRRWLRALRDLLKSLA